MIVKPCGKPIRSRRRKQRQQRDTVDVPGFSEFVERAEEAGLKIRTGRLPGRSAKGDSLHLMVNRGSWRLADVYVGWSGTSIFLGGSVYGQRRAVLDLAEAWTHIEQALAMDEGR